MTVYNMFPFQEPIRVHSVTSPQTDSGDPFAAVKDAEEGRMLTHCSRSICLSAFSEMHVVTLPVSIRP